MIHQINIFFLLVMQRILLIMQCNFHFKHQIRKSFFFILFPSIQIEIQLQKKRTQMFLAVFINSQQFIVLKYFFLYNYTSCFLKKCVINLNLRQYSVSRMVCVGMGLSDKSINYWLLTALLMVRISELLILWVVYIPVWLVLD